MTYMIIGIDPADSESESFVVYADGRVTKSTPEDIHTVVNKLMQEYKEQPIYLRKKKGISLYDLLH